MLPQFLQWLGLAAITAGVGLLLGVGAAVVCGGICLAAAGTVLELEKREG